MARFGNTNGEGEEMAKDIYEGTVLTKEVKLTGGDPTVGDTINVDIVYLRDGTEVKKESQTLASSTAHVTCTYEAPEVKPTEEKYELLRKVLKNTKPIDVEDFVVYPKSGKVTVVNTADEKPMPGFKLVVRKNGKQVGRIYETVVTTKPEGPAEAPYALDTGVDPGPYEIQGVSPYLIKTYVSPAAKSPQPHTREIQITGDKMPYTAMLENPVGSETEPTDPSIVYSTENPTTRGVGFLEVRIAASDRSRVTKDDAVNVEVECKRRTKRTDAKAPDVKGWVAKADWADGTDPYTKTRTWAKKLDLSSGTVAFDIYLGVAGGDEFIIRVGMKEGQWDHQAKIITWRKLKILVVRPVAALVANYSDDNKVLDEGVSTGTWAALSTAFAKAYITCVAHSSSRRFTEDDLKRLTPRGTPMLRWTLPATVFGKASSEPDDLVLSKEAGDTIIKSSWVVSEPGSVNAVLVGKIVQSENRTIRVAAKDAIDEMVLPNMPGVMYTENKYWIHKGTARNCPDLVITVTHYDDSGTWKTVKSPAKFTVSNIAAVPLVRVGDKTTVDLTNAQYKLANKPPEVTGIFTKDSNGKITLGALHASILKGDSSQVTVGTKLKVALDGSFYTLGAALGGYAEGPTTIMALRTPAFDGRLSNPAGIALAVAHEIGHFLGFAYLNPSVKAKALAQNDDGTVDSYNQTPIAGVDFKKYFDDSGNGYFGKGGSGPHCNIGMTTEQKKAELWAPLEAAPTTGVKLDPWPECIMFGWVHPLPTKVEFCPDCLRVLREADILESRDGRVK